MNMNMFGADLPTMTRPLTASTASRPMTACSGASSFRSTDSSFPLGWMSLLGDLRALGYDDDRKNAEMLIKARGDVTKARAYLDRDRPKRDPMASPLMCFQTSRPVIPAPTQRTRVRRKRPQRLDDGNLATPKPRTYAKKAPEGTLSDQEVKKLCHDQRVQARMKELASGSGSAWRDACFQAATWLADGEPASAQEPETGRQSKQTVRTTGSCTVRSQVSTASRGSFQSIVSSKREQPRNPPRGPSLARCKYIANMSLRRCNSAGAGPFRDGLGGSIRAGGGLGNEHPFEAYLRAQNGPAVYRDHGTHGGPRDVDPRPTLTRAAHYKVDSGMKDRGPVLLFE